MTVRVGAGIPFLTVCTWGQGFQFLDSARVHRTFIFLTVRVGFHFLDSARGHRASISSLYTHMKNAGQGCLVSRHSPHGAITVSDMLYTPPRPGLFGLSLYTPSPSTMYPCTPIPHHTSGDWRFPAINGVKWLCIYCTYNQGIRYN